MTKITLTVPPDHTPDEEAALVARVAAAVTAETGREDVTVELLRSEEVTVAGPIGDRMAAGSRWNA